MLNYLVSKLQEKVFIVINMRWLLEKVDQVYYMAQKFKNKFSTHQVKIISLIAMTTNEERMKTIAQQAEGFIYTITMNATTGKNEQFHQS